MCCPSDNPLSPHIPGAQDQDPGSAAFERMLANPIAFAAFKSTGACACCFSFVRRGGVCAEGVFAEVGGWVRVSSAASYRSAISAPETVSVAEQLPFTCDPLSQPLAEL